MDFLTAGLCFLPFAAMTAISDKPIDSKIQSLPAKEGRCFSAPVIITILPPLLVFPELGESSTAGDSATIASLTGVTDEGRLEMLMSSSLLTTDIPS